MEDKMRLSIPVNNTNQSRKLKGLTTFNKGIQNYLTINSGVSRLNSDCVYIEVEVLKT